jgi:hypothetical protein
MPFTGVMAISLLLAGTLGQESRALSRQPTAFELVRYSRFIPWLLATWIVTFINVAIFIDALLVIGIVFFSHSTGPDHVQILSTAACLTAAACCAGSLVVPYRRDILAQLFSTAVYGVLAWGIFRVLQTGNRLGITLMIVGICLGTALLFENMRWRKSIRGKYVFA